MKVVTTVLCVMFFAATAIGQVASGPAAGSVNAGVMVNTNNFDADNLPAGPVQEVHHLHVIPPPPAPPAGLPPSPPAFSNRQIDPSMRHDASPLPPPITLGSFQGIPQTGYVPPDPHIAVGPNHIIAMVNSTFRIYDKAGNILKTINCGSWLNTVIPGVSPSDPKVIYDQFEGRWVMSWIESNDVSRANYVVSVSDDSDPLGVWYNYALPSNLNGTTNAGNWADYQGMGFDNQAIYFTSNQFQFGGNYQYVKIRIVNKAQLYANTGGPVSWFDFWNLRDASGNGVIGTRPSVTYGTPGVYYLVGNAPYNPASYFIVYRITNPLTAPTITATHVSVTNTYLAPDAQQLGGGNLINGGGFNLGLRNEPVYMDSALWLVHSVMSPNGQSDIRYVKINTVNNFAIEDVAFGADGFYHIFPAMMVDQNKNIVITYSRTGATEYVGAFYTWRLDSDPTGLRGSILTQPGVANYQGGGNPNRWGDYQGVAVDPSDRNNLWMITEYAAGSSSWSTWVHGARLVPFPGIRLYTSASSLNFGLVEAGFTSDTSSITINNIGSSTLTLSGISHAQSSFTLLNLPSFPANLNAFDSITVRIVFHPTVHGTVNDTIAIASNDPSSPVTRIALRAKGIVIGRAEAGKMYAVSGNPSQFYTINQQTGAATLVGPTGVQEIDGLAIRPSTKEMYGVLSNASGSTLYRMSSQNGDALRLRSIAIPNMRAITFSLAGDTLFAGTTTGRLYRINVDTGDTTYIGTASGKIYSGFAISPTSHILWASVRPPLSGRDSIFTVNRANGSAAGIGRTGLGIITPYLACDTQGRLMAIIGSGAQTNTLYAIDTLTGTGTLIGSTGVTGLLAIAMRTDSSGTSGVAPGTMAGMPASFALEQNYPNPFNPTTVIQYSLPRATAVTLRVYNLLGQEVRTLVNGNQPAGQHSVEFDATSLASGVYLYKLEAGTFVATRKLLLLR
jgi:hypothetical protein